MANLKPKNKRKKAQRRQKFIVSFTSIQNGRLQLKQMLEEEERCGYLSDITVDRVNIN